MNFYKEWKIRVEDMANTVEIIQTDPQYGIKIQNESNKIDAVLKYILNY